MIMARDRAHLGGAEDVLIWPRRALVRPGLRRGGGIDLRRGLSESGSPFPIIFMTTVDDKATRQQAMDVG